MTQATAAPSARTEGVRDRAQVSRRIRLLVVFGVVTLLTLCFWLSTDDPHVRYLFSELSPENQPHTTNATWILVGAFVVSALATIAAALGQVRPGWRSWLVFALVGIAFFASFLVWNYVDQDAAFITNPFPEAINQATPLVLGALAGVLCERAGIINIAIEGQFLMGAFFGAVFSSLFYSAEMGLVGGILAGVLMAALLAWFAMRFEVNQVVLGVVLIALATGLTSFLLSQIPDDGDVKQYLNEPLILEHIRIPGLADIPLVGPALFDQSLLTYLMYAAVVFVFVLLYRTRWGLRVRAVGEHPTAADTVGVKVLRIRWQAVLLGGVFAGLGGSYFTVGSTGAFDENASAGNGFIALAAVIMGRWHPIGATFSALFFGLMWSLQAQLTFTGRIPEELLRASPYLMTVIAVAGFVGRVRPPAADGEPYRKH